MKSDKESLKKYHINQFNDNISYLQHNKHRLSDRDLRILSIVLNKKEIQISKEIRWANGLRYIMDKNYKFIKDREIEICMDENINSVSSLKWAYSAVCYDFKRQNADILYEWMGKTLDDE